MGVTINASNNYISDQGAIIQQYNEYSSSDAVHELREINAKLDCLDEIHETVTSLDQALSTHEHSKAKKHPWRLRKSFCQRNIFTTSQRRIKKTIFLKEIYVIGQYILGLSLLMSTLLGID